MSDGDHREVSEVREEVTRALIPSVTESELSQRICERFAESDLCSFAWVGRCDSSEERVISTTAAGTDVDALDEVFLEGDSPRQSVVRAAMETRDVQVERELLDDPPSADWGDHAQDHGYQSVAVVPLVHEEALYGVLYLAADRPDGFDADEQDILAILGETIGYALDDIQTGDGAERDEVEQNEGGRDESDLERGVGEQGGRESERRLRAILDGTDEFIGLLEPDGTMLDANRASLEWDGATRENSVGVPFWEAAWFVNTPEAREKVQEAVARAAEGEFVRQELDLQDSSGEVTTLDFSLHPVEGEDGGVDYLVPEGREITGHKERERELEQYKTVADTASDVIVSIDEQSVVQSVNPAIEDVFGYEPDELVGEPLTKLMPESLREQHREGLQRHIRTGERAVDWDYLELAGLHADGHELPLAVSFSEYEHDGEQFFTGIIRDNTDRKRFEQTLTNLHDVSRDLIQAESREEVSRRTVDATRDVLGVDGVGIYLFDDSENALEPVASTEHVKEIFGELATFTPEDTAITWQAFITGETIALPDILESDDAHRRDTPLRSGVWVPLGDHGVLGIVSEQVGAFDQQTQRLADHLAATAEAALDRVEREESLRDQEQALEQRNRQLQNLNRTNDIIREIDKGLVDATTREEIEQAVCGLLTRDERFAFAWIGEADDEAVTPRTWAGDDQGYLDAVSLTAGGDSGDPAVTTAATGNATLVSNVAANLRNEPWRKTALARDLQSVISIPLRYNGMDYGVLAVYATQPDAFDELSQTILRELGETIANAMNFVDTRQALLSDHVVELELEIREADDPLVQLARQTGSEFEFHGIVPQTAGTARVFVTASGATADSIRAAAAESTRIENVSLLSGDGDDDGASRLEIGVAGATIPSTLVECGAVVRSMLIAGTETSVVVELPHSTRVRTFVDRLEESYPDTELIARRDRERTDQSPEGFEATLTASLTRRQLETLQTAYHSGYFEWPRDRTGEEVAEALDITQPTFNGHLRAAERKLCAMLFDGVPPTQD